MQQSTGSSRSSTAINISVSIQQPQQYCIATLAGLVPVPKENNVGRARTSTPTRMQKERQVWAILAHTNAIKKLSLSCRQANRDPARGQASENPQPKQIRQSRDSLEPKWLEPKWLRRQHDDWEIISCRACVAKGLSGDAPQVRCARFPLSPFVAKGFPFSL